MSDQKNTILAIALSALVFIVWQYFFGFSLQEKQKQVAQQQQQAQQTQPPAAPAETRPAAPGQLPGTGPAQTTEVPRDDALAKSPRVLIDTSRIVNGKEIGLKGSIALTGGRLDDLSLLQYRETVEPNSPAIILLSPSGSAHPFYAEFGWVPAAGTNVKLPGEDTQWKQEGSGALGIGRPVTLTWDNGQGLEFRRTISIDDRYMFSLRDDVVNKGTTGVTLYPYALISRHGVPPTLGYYILFEGLIGVLGDKLQEVKYTDIEKSKVQEFKDVKNGWLGFTDKYWAAVLVPQTTDRLDAKMSSGMQGNVRTFQTDYLLDARNIAPGATGSADARLFAGAKEVATVNGYERELGLNRFKLLIDWGMFWFITQPMFAVIDYFFRLVGNFGVAILIVTVLVKLAFFPLANKSYASMAKMKAVQPQMAALRERYPDDKVKQQQEMMELYKREKINPVAGCLPIVIQIPVFFSLYKVLFITIEMRHAPFFGWIRDLSAPDPTNIFTLFGMIPWEPQHLPVIGSFLVLGIWPLIMGVTMWVQMKLNPAPPDPTQKMIFDWMPVIFTFMLSNFSAGLVIYWAWNNTLSVLQQSVIMHKNGAKIELFDNLKATFAKKKKA
ncbi:MAG: membrane protein insertase YidC [Hyphomicrobiales bacterium]|nr:membrane protein insertase YidC [Hyphomicrobiales bacterium]